jgi:hypothetical protein
MVLAAFILSFLYWVYLGFTTRMVIGGDAQGYQLLAEYIQAGWSTFFATGPQREPLYPLFISQCMRLGEFFHVPHLHIQTAFQIIVFGFTQYLLYLILKRLNVRPVITACAVLYFGFSPSLVNSAFSSYSEILTYPLILSILLLASHASQKFNQASFTKVISWGVALGLLFVALTSVKAVFELIFLLFLIPLLWKKPFSKILIFVLAAVLTYEVPIISYKKLNENTNGQYALTDRGGWALYGNTVRRMQPLNLNRLIAAAAYVPGEGFCRQVLDEKRCFEWSTGPSDKIGLAANGTVAASNIAKTKRNSYFIKESAKEVFKNPPQYLLLAGLESFKILFWESTKIGFVIYPKWLDAFFDLSIFKNLLRVSAFLMTCIIVTLSLNLFFRRQLPGFLMWSLFLMFIYIFIHAPFFILTRYAFPIVPLILLLGAYCMEVALAKRKQY